MFKAKKITKEPESVEKAYEYAVFLLSLQLRSSGELEEKLKGKGFTPNIVSQTISVLQERHYLDDQALAQTFLDNLKKYKNFGFYGIQKKFIQKRIPKTLIDQTLEVGLPMEEELKIAQRFLKKEGLEVGEKSDQLLKKKIAQRLQSRGFRGEVISKLIF